MSSHTGVALGPESSVLHLWPAWCPTDSLRAVTLPWGSGVLIAARSLVSGTNIRRDHQIQNRLSQSLSVLSRSLFLTEVFSEADIPSACTLPATSSPEWRKKKRDEQKGSGKQIFFFKKIDRYLVSVIFFVLEMRHSGVLIVMEL